MDLVLAELETAAALPSHQIREYIDKLQDHMVQVSTNALTDCPVRHVHAPGLYAREMTIPEGMLIISKIHKKAHVVTMSSGRIRVLTEHGITELVAPCTFVSEVGAKRVGYALENTVWTTYHPTEETDIDKIEAEVIATDYSEIELIGEFNRE